MTQRIVSTNRLSAALFKQGLLPKNCMNIEIHNPVKGGVVLRYEVLVDVVDLGKLAAAFLEVEADLKSEYQ